MASAMHDHRRILAAVAAGDAAAAREAMAAHLRTIEGFIRAPPDRAGRSRRRRRRRPAPA